MIDKKIEEKLIAITPVEQEQIDQHGKNIQDVGNANTIPNNPIRLMPYWNFFDYGRIAVTQSNRFSYIPAHTHQFIEMNYCFSGRSIQYIDDKLVILHPGQLLIMDRDIQQRINYARRQDILLNILIRDDYEITQLLSNTLDKKTVFINFLKNVTKKNIYHHNFLVIDLNKDIVSKQLIENIISIGYQNHGENTLLLHSLMRSFILNCKDNFIINKQMLFSNITENKDLQVIEYINQNYQNLTLKKLATHFGYHPNYLSKIITRTAGHTFKELIQMRKLNIACNLLQTSKFSIDQVSEYVGYNDHSSLFRLFKKYLGITPQNYRYRIQLPHELDDIESPLPNPYFK